MLNAIAAFGRGKKTATAGTRIRALVPGDKHGYTYITFFRYTVSTTAHTLTLMRGQSRGKATAAVAEGGTSLVVDTALKDGAGNAIAANDVVAYETVDNGWVLDTVSGWDATSKTITLTTGPASGSGGIAVGAKVVAFGVAGDAGHADYQFASGTSTTASFPAVANAGPLCKGAAINDPVIFDSDNATAAGTLEGISAEYANR